MSMTDHTNVGNWSHSSLAVSWPHGELIELSVDAALETPGVHTILTHQDIPGINDASPLAHDEELLVSKTAILSSGLLYIAGESLEACEMAAKIKWTLENYRTFSPLKTRLPRKVFAGPASTLVGGGS